jgi:hypothetical protein
MRSGTAIVFAFNILFEFIAVLTRMKYRSVPQAY